MHALRAGDRHCDNTCNAQGQRAVLPQNCYSEVRKSNTPTETRNPEVVTASSILLSLKFMVFQAPIPIFAAIELIHDCGGGGPSTQVERFRQ